MSAEDAATRPSVSNSVTPTLLPEGSLSPFTAAAMSEATRAPAPSRGLRRSANRPQCGRVRSRACGDPAERTGARQYWRWTAPTRTRYRRHRPSEPARDAPTHRGYAQARGDEREGEREAESRNNRGDEWCGVIHAAEQSGWPRPRQWQMRRPIKRRRAASCDAAQFARWRAGRYYATLSPCSAMSRPSRSCVSSTRRPTVAFKP